MWKNFNLPSEVYSYFKKTKGDSVVNWWNPENSSLAFLYRRQVNILGRWLKTIITFNNRQPLRILELGVGKGRVYSQLFQYGFFRKSQVELFGVEINPKMLKIASSRFYKEKIPCQLYLIGNYRLPFPDNFFDLVFSLETFVHLPEPIKSLREWKRITKSGGWIIFDVDNSLSLKRIIRKIAIIFGQKPKGIGIFRPYSAKEIQELLKRTHLKLVKNCSLGVFPWSSLDFINCLLEKLPGIKKIAYYYLFLCSVKK